MLEIFDSYLLIGLIALPMVGAALMIETRTGRALNRRGNTHTHSDRDANARTCG